MAAWYSDEIVDLDEEMVRRVEAFMAASRPAFKIPGEKTARGSAFRL